MVGVTDLAKAFTTLGIADGDTILVHSSLKSLGTRLDGGANAVIEALLKCVGTEGTLFFPALSYLNVTREQPVFDVRNTASNVGLIPEVFRKEYASHRSSHPTHSVCGLGPLAGEVARNHYLDTTPCGENSPFALLPPMGAKLIMLGCSLRRNTTIHAVEEFVGVPYVIRDELEYELIDWEGSSRKVTHHCHWFENLDQWYEKIVPALPRSGYVKGKVCAADTYVMDLASVWTSAVRELERDPYSLVGPL